jgi:putative endonuclease
MGRAARDGPGTIGSGGGRSRAAACTRASKRLVRVHRRGQGIRRGAGYQEAMTDAWVYMLRCADGTLYTGWTTDVQRRLSRHCAGTASRYTASRLPVELALALPMRDRSQARREEARIKALNRTAKLALITENPHSEPSQAPTSG